MNDHDAAKVLAILGAAWPNQELPDPTVDLWMGLLSDLAYEDGKAAAKTVIKEDTFFPSISRFLQAAQAARHGRENRLAAERGLPSAHRAVPPPERLLKLTRQLLRERSTKKHWHGGPDPCPVCGGIAPEHLRKGPA